MAMTLEQIQNRVAALIDQRATAPTVGTTEYTWRTELINRALEEWQMAYDWEALRKQTFIAVNGGASITLPNDFRKTAGNPVLYSPEQTDGEAWEEILPEDVHLFDATEKYFYISGNRQEGHFAIWSPGTLVSGASLFFPYYSYPTSLVSPTDSTPIQHPDFLAQRAASMIWESRGDSRFQIAESRAREMLLQMIDNEESKGLALDYTVQTPEQRSNFRIGRD